MVKLGCDPPPLVLLRDSVQAGQLQPQKLNQVPVDFTPTLKAIIRTYLHAYLHISIRKDYF